MPSTSAVRSDFGLIVAVGRAWNSIPVGIRRSCTIGSFKKRFKNFLNKKKNYNQLFILFIYLDLIQLFRFGGVIVVFSMYICIFFFFFFFLSKCCGDRLYSGGDW